MADSTNPPASGRSLPDDIAAKAGLPHGEEAGHALHAIDERARRQANAGAEAVRAHADEARDRVEQAAETAARETADAGSDLRERVSDAAGTARERVGETIDRARDRASDAYDDVRSWASDRYDAQSRRVSALAERGTRRLREGRSATETFVSDNPLLVGVVGLAAGLLLGALLPRTRREDEALGPYADEVRDQGLRYAREMTHRGRAFVETALDTDNLDAAVRRANAGPDEPSDGDEGPERRAHRL